MLSSLRSQGILPELEPEPEPDPEPDPEPEIFISGNRNESKDNAEGTSDIL
jgi:hypothetical protein